MLERVSNATKPRCFWGINALTQPVNKVPESLISFRRLVSVQATQRLKLSVLLGFLASTKPTAETFVR